MQPHAVMEKQSSSIKHFVEFLPRIQAVQFAVTDSCTYLSFRSRSLCIRQGRREERDGRSAGEAVKVCSWEVGPELHLPSFLDLKVIPGEALHVRFRLNPQGGGGRGLKERGFADEFASSKEPCLLVLKCAFCHHCLTESNYIFRRVLPLPSEAWQEFSGNLFCHAHHAQTGCGDGRLSTTTNSVALLLPKEGDCLISGTSVLVRSSALSPEKVLVKTAATSGERGEAQSEKVLCKRCLSYLGDCMTAKGMDSTKSSPGETGREKRETASAHPAVSSIPFNLRRPQLILEERKGAEGLPVSSTHSLPTARQTVEDYLARTLHAASRSRMAFRFLIQDNLKQTYLCIWMLNVITRVICNSYPTGEASVLSRFTNEGCGGSHHASAEKCNLKLLYNYVLDSGAPTQWTDDKVGVEVLELSIEECLWLVLMLADSNRTLPPSQRITNGFRTLCRDMSNSSDIPSAAGCSSSSSASCRDSSESRPVVSILERLRAP